MFSKAFAAFQKIGRSLQLPVAVLPIAGILIRIGQTDLLGNPHLLGGQLSFIGDMGGGIFNNMPILFCLGVAIGFAFDGGGAACLAAAVGYYAMTAGITHFGANLNTGVFGGICIGITAGLYYNKFHNIKLPDFLAFFGGKRFVPIITGLTAILWAIFFGLTWPIIGAGLQGFGNWVVHAGAIGFFAFGVLNRLLLAFGLHMVLNAYIWFQYGTFQTAHGAVTGDLSRFFAGDPTAGYFMSGFFLIMMFGLPGACLGMYKAVPKEKRKLVVGIYFSIAIVAFITGVTEPIEYTFLFVAPVLYGIHALLTGTAVALAYMLHIRAGFTFSGGAFDYFLNMKLGSANNWLLMPIGIVYFCIYFVVFYFGIKILKAPIPGLDGIEEKQAAYDGGEQEKTQANAYIYALGGKENLVQITACMTRLRLTIKDSAAINEDQLKKLGVRGVVKPTKETIQVIVGLGAELLAGEMTMHISHYTEEIGKDAFGKMTGSAVAETKTAVTEKVKKAITIVSPLAGKVIPIEEVPDPTFAEKMVGDGIAIIPEGNDVVAPVDGVIETIYETKHAFSMTSTDGAEVLVHVGIDTVKLDGKGFEVVAKEGAIVKAGTPILKIDLDFLKANAPSVITPVIIANSDEYTIEKLNTNKVVATKAEVMKLS